MIQFEYNGTIVIDPSQKSIEDGLYELEEDVDSFAILERQTFDYVQVARTSPTDYVVDYRDCSEGPNRLIERQALSTAISILQAFARGEDDWKSAYPWQVVE